MEKKSINVVLIWKASYVSFSKDFCSLDTCSLQSYSGAVHDDFICHIVATFFSIMAAIDLGHLASPQKISCCRVPVT